MFTMPSDAVNDAQFTWAPTYLFNLFFSFSQFNNIEDTSARLSINCHRFRQADRIKLFRQILILHLHDSQIIAYTKSSSFSWDGHNFAMYHMINGEQWSAGSEVCGVFEPRLSFNLFPRRIWIALLIRCNMLADPVCRYSLNVRRTYELPHLRILAHSVSLQF